MFVCVFGLRGCSCCNLMCVHIVVFVPMKNVKFITTQFIIHLLFLHLVLLEPGGGGGNGPAVFFGTALSFLLWERKCKRLLVLGDSMYLV